jgi:hypothetical protein
LLKSFESVFVFVWLRSRVWSWFFEAVRELSKLLVLEELLVTSEEVLTSRCMFAPRE